MDKIEGFLDKYEKQMKGKTSDEYLFEYKKLFKDYNFRRENSLEEGKEEYLFFFNNLKEIERCNSLFRDFLISNCNLINKIKDFIEKF